MALKKLMLQGCVLFIFSALLIGCESSEKGKWTDADKEMARNEMEKELLKSPGEGGEFFAIKENRDQFLDCSLGKLEQTYSSYSEANQDLKGCEKIGEECALALIEAATPTTEKNSASTEGEEKPNDQ